MQYDDEKWREHWRDAAATLIERGSRHAVPYAGLQLHWMGDAVLGDELIALATVSRSRRTRTIAMQATTR